jgi:hypothetical protein
MADEQQETPNAHDEPAATPAEGKAPERPSRPQRPERARPGDRLSYLEDFLPAD